MSEVQHIGPFRLAPHVRDGKPTGKWVLDLRARNSRKGRRQRKFFDSVNKAIECARKYERDAYRGILPTTGHDAAGASRMSLFQLLDEWKRDQELEVAAGAKRQSSLVRDLDHFKSLKRFLRDIRISEITETRLKEYVAWRVKNGISKATIKTDIVSIGKVLRWAVKQQLLPTMPPLPKIRPPKVRLDVPTHDEIRRIIEASASHISLLIRFLAATGCRKGEALALRWSDIDLDERRVYVRSREGWTAKTEHSERDFVIADDGLFADLVAAKNGKSEFVFSGKNSTEPLGSFRKAFQTAVRKADIRRGERRLRVTPHSLRKAWATWAANEAKLHPAVIKRMMGHSPSSNVADGWYIEVTLDAVKSAWRKVEAPSEEPSGATKGQQPQNQSGPLPKKRAA